MVINLPNRGGAAPMGPKYDSGKPPLGYVPKELIESAARGLDYGSKKYKKHDFKLGIEHSRLIDALLRHVYAYAAGEDNDPESGLSHLDHAAATLGMLQWMRANRPELDDRYRPEVVNPNR